MEATDQSVTDYFLYVKNVLGVKTLQSSSIRELLQNPSPDRETTGPLLDCDLLFLNIRTENEASIFSPEIKALGDKMIQAMRLGSRKILILETEEGAGAESTKFLQEYSQKVQTPFVVFFSAKPKVQGVIKNLGSQKYIETFSPSYLVDHPQAKKVAWLDLQKVMKEFGIS